MADLFENIVTGWLTSKGYFVMQGLKAGRYELDVLAVKVKNGEVVKGIHAEIQCSSDPIGYLGADKKAGKRNQIEVEQGVKEYIKKKYEASPVKVKAEALLGKRYEKQFVYGRLKDEDIQIAALKANGITVVKISEIIDDLRKMKAKESLMTTDIYRFQQMLKLCGDSSCSQKIAVER